MYTTKLRIFPLHSGAQRWHIRIAYPKVGRVNQLQLSPGTIATTISNISFGPCWLLHTAQLGSEPIALSAAASCATPIEAHAARTSSRYSGHLMSRLVRRHTVSKSKSSGKRWEQRRNQRSSKGAFPLARPRFVYMLQGLGMADPIRLVASCSVAC